MLGVRGIPVIRVEKTLEQLGYTGLEFGNVNFRVSIWLVFGAG